MRLRISLVYLGEYESENLNLLQRVESSEAENKQMPQEFSDLTSKLALLEPELDDNGRLCQKQNSEAKSAQIPCSADPERAAPISLESALKMVKEWTSEYFAARNQNQKTKPPSYESRDKAYPTSYGLNESMNICTKWYAPPTSERNPLSLISSASTQPASASNNSETGSSERILEHKQSKLPHVCMLQQKRLHAAKEMFLNNSSCSAPEVIVLSDEEQPSLNGYGRDGKNSNSKMPLLLAEKQWNSERISPHHVHMLPGKTLHAATEMLHESARSCSSPDVIVLSDEERPCLNGHLNGYESDGNNKMPPLPSEKEWNFEKTSEYKKRKSHYVNMLPGKRLHATKETYHISGSNCSLPDVIVHSNEEQPRINGPHPKGYESDEKNSEMSCLLAEELWDSKEFKEKMRQHKHLCGKLKNEEMKLVLLKKLQQSQMIKENLLNQAAAAVANKMVPTGTRNASDDIPLPPLVRTGQIPQSQNKFLGQQLTHQTSMMSSPLNPMDSNEPKATSNDRIEVITIA